MTGTNCDLFTQNQSRSYLNHFVRLHRILFLVAATKLHYLDWHLLLCSTDAWSGLSKNSISGEINLQKTQINLGLNAAPQASWPRVRVDHFKDV